MFGKGKARSGARAGLLTGAVVAALGISALSAGTAAAAPSCAGTAIKGAGSSLQKEAQLSLWNPGFTAQCPSGPTVSYEVTSSGKGLGAWGMTEPGKTLNNALAFVGSDDGPKASQIANGESASGGSKILVIPVAQTAITAVVNPPAECEIEELTNKQLESIFRGTIKNWGKVETAFGPGCTGAPITRVVREEGSGTTYQFKNYLSKINTAPVACTEGTKTWVELEEIGTGEKPNTEWPANGVAGCTATQVTPIVKAAGGGAVVKAVNANEGAIGYAALPDVEFNKTGDTLPVKIQNNGLVKLANATFASPGLEGNSAANCAASQYQVPAAGRAGSGTGEGVDWSTVFGAKIAIGGEGYPLCTLTYDVSLTKYSKAGFTEGAEITARDYLKEYLTATSGQSVLKNGKKFYAALPSAPATPALDVLGAAQLAASKIGF